MRMLKKIIKRLVTAVFALVLLFALVLGLLTLFNKRSPEELAMTLVNPVSVTMSKDDQFTITTFNIGYAGLDKNEDFFMDGGSGSRSSSREQTLENMDNIMTFLNGVHSDFYFIQEVDKKAARSYNVDEYGMLNHNFENYASAFAWNYDAPYVPIPVSKPMGYVSSGIMTFSKYQTTDATRIQLPGKIAWPIQLFELDRCILTESVPLDNGKTLVLVNLHLSAYDKGGTVRKQELAYLKTYMNAQYEAGNYVVLGGDWNNLLSTAQLADPVFMKNWPDWLVKLPDDFLNTEFQWGIDERVYTVRDDATVYVPGKSFVTYIDGYLVSPNIEIVSVQGHDLGFENSDHNPVTITLKLK